MAHKAVEMKRSERSDAEIQLSKQVVQTFPSYAGAAGKALLLRDGPTLKKIEKLVSLMSVFCGLTPELSRAAKRRRLE